VSDRQNTIQLVTFQLGKETYGIDIMQVTEIVGLQEIRPIPTAPGYVAGILNLRGLFVPIIDLHKRFHFEKASLTESERRLSGFVIIDVEGTNLGVIIDRVSRVVTVNAESVQPPPQLIAGIGNEYISGVVRSDESDGEEYLLILNVSHLFDARELSELDSLT
jgi:purine-binding chemotaxis protein CheW